MPEEKRERSYFLDTVLASLIGTAAGCMAAYYVNGRQGMRLDRYIDGAMKFLDSVKKRTGPPGYGQDK